MQRPTGKKLELDCLVSKIEEIESYSVSFLLLSCKDLFVLLQNFLVFKGDFFLFEQRFLFVIDDAIELL